MRPVLHLSGPRLEHALETLVAGAEPNGGIERWIAAVKFKNAFFERALAAELDETTFGVLCAMMPSVRRRIAPWLAAAGFAKARALVERLLDGSTADADDRIADFCARFPATREHRYARDLAAELVHWSGFERYPLMNRWVWDRGAGTGALREIWHDEEDPALNAVPDTYETFLVLREELAQYLSDNGFFRDVPCYADLLCAQVYASYICEQGGSFLRTDFSTEHDPMQYVRRMLGLDGIDPDTGLTRMKLPDGSAFRFDAALLS